MKEEVAYNHYRRIAVEAEYNDLSRSVDKMVKVIYAMAAIIVVLFVYIFTN